jgi:EpsD family peptidyl-prolyl cis-trans isomerase
MKKAICLPLLVLVAAVVLGCGKESDKKAATQVVARVNGDEITIHQVNAALGRQSVRPDQAEAAKRQALERLIDQHLAKQQAVEKKLDRTPRVVQAIEAAKNEILSRAYLEQIATEQQRAGAEEVKKYYADHPELFSQRRLYSVEQITVADNQSPTVKEHLAKARDLADLAAWLKSQNARFAQDRGVRAAEQIPLEWLPEVHKMKDGDVRIFEQDNRLTVLRIVATRAAAVDEATAAPRIEQFLFNRRLRQAIAAEIKSLRQKSNIEYAGEFAGGAAEAKSEPETFQPAQPEAPAVPNMEKAIRGLR